MIIQATIKFVGPRQGGRSTPAQPGYRPHVRVGDKYTSCSIDAVDDAVRTFGFDESIDVYINPLYPEHFGDEPQAGEHLHFFEGKKLVAIATVN